VAVVIFLIFTGLALLLGVGGLVFYLVAVRPVESFPERVAGALGRVMRAETSVETNVITVEKRDIAELAVVSRKTQAVVKSRSLLLGSESVLILRGDFLVKAGFDLTEPFSVEVDEVTGTVDAHFPPAKILSMEMTNYEVFHADEGLWNRLKPEDQELATKEMLLKAREEAEASDIKAEAEARLVTRLRDLLGAGEETLQVRGDPVILP